MELKRLYDFAKQQNIGVFSFPLPETGSLSHMTDSGECFIGIDDSIRDGNVQERVHLDHELGHCVNIALTGDPEVPPEDFALVMKLIGADKAECDVCPLLCNEFAD